VLYLHGQDGNLGGSVDDLAALHTLGLNVFAFDYRGYGQSQFQRPSESHWSEDAESALGYLTATRHIAAGTIILNGKNLGANLALELAAAHPELAGVVLESPLDSPMNAIFNDPRAHLVPAHLLVRERFDAERAGNALLIPSLWIVSPLVSDKAADQTKHPAGYDRITARKALIWLDPAPAPDPQFAQNYTRWLDDLPKRSGNP
jgi:pimeloyl-ACP methyl ester carboxylesterase